MFFWKHNPATKISLGEVPFLMSTDASNRSRFAAPKDVVVDEPYGKSGLGLIYPGSPKLAATYHEVVEGIVEFASAFGARTSLKFERVDAKDNPEFLQTWRWADRETSNSTNTDWDLPEFEQLLQTGESKVLKIVWDLVNYTSVDFASAHYRANGKAPRREFPSRLVQRLSTSSWLPDRDGNLKKPRDISADMLAEGWAQPKSHVARSIGFGLFLQEEVESQSHQEEAAKSLDIPMELVNLWKTMPESDRLQVLDDLRMRNTPFPGSPSANPDSRFKRKLADALDAPDYETEFRSLSVDSRPNRENRKLGKEYLRNWYSDGEKVRCQVCSNPSEFRVKEGGYFESVQFIKNLKKLHHVNFLALCPSCSAKYQHVLETSESELIEMIKGLEVPEDVPVVQLPIHLNGKVTQVNFSATHAVDLQAVLTASDERR
jgi:hypothetical protein